MTNKVSPAELAQARKDIGFVFDLLTATSLAELDLVITRAYADGAFFGQTTARIIEEQRAKLGKTVRPS